MVARRLAHAHDDVRVVHLAEKGRGRALKQVWAHSDADVLVYMDVDLSTDLNALLPLVAPLISGHSDLAIGSRLRHGSRVVRGPKREVISRGYNLLVKGALRTRFSDAQCGFKAIRADVAREVLPLVEDDAWFFDTELLVLAERAGLRIHEVPVDWVDDPDSRVDLARTAYDDLRGIARLGRSLLTGRLPLGEVSERLGRASADAGGGRLGMQLAMFAIVGVGLDAGLRRALPALRGCTGALTANLVALLVTAVGNTAANRRLTFGVRGPRGAVRHQAQGLLVFGVGLAVTSGAHLAAGRRAAPPGVEVVVLTAANLAVTLMRFVAMRLWVFRGVADGLEPDLADLVHDAPFGVAALEAHGAPAYRRRPGTAARDWTRRGARRGRDGRRRASGWRRCRGGSAAPAGCPGAARRRCRGGDRDRAMTSSMRAGWSARSWVSWGSAADAVSAVRSRSEASDTSRPGSVQPKQANGAGAADARPPPPPRPAPRRARDRQPARRARGPARRARPRR